MCLAPHRCGTETDLGSQVTWEGQGVGPAPRGPGTFCDVPRARSLLRVDPEGAANRTVTGRGLGGQRQPQLWARRTVTVCMETGGRDSRELRASVSPLVQRGPVCSRWPLASCPGALWVPLWVPPMQGGQRPSEP